MPSAKLDEPSGDGARSSGFRPACRQAWRNVAFIANVPFSHPPSRQLYLPIGEHPARTAPSPPAPRGRRTRFSLAGLARSLRALAEAR